MISNSNHKINDKLAVSAVIGVILMVAITVSVAGTVYYYVSGISGETVPQASSLSMNVYSRDDLHNQTIWFVSGLSGEAVRDGSYETSLIHQNGTKDTGATIVKQETVEAGYVNAGDTFIVTASQDGYYTFVVTDTISSSPIFKSALTKY